LIPWFPLEALFPTSQGRQEAEKSRTSEEEVKEAEKRREKKKKSTSNFMSDRDFLLHCACKNIIAVAQKLAADSSGLQQLELLCLAALQTEDRSIVAGGGGEFKILSSETCGLVEHDILLLLLENVAGHVRSCRPRNLLYSSRIVKDPGEKIVDLLRSVSVVDLIINFLDLSSSAWLD
jgi:hypothetical protein